MTVSFGASTCRTAHSKVIFLSARNMDLDQIYAIECGGDDYLTKPFSYDVVTAKSTLHLRIYGEYALQERKL